MFCRVPDGTGRLRNIQQSYTIANNCARIKQKKVYKNVNLQILLTEHLTIPVSLQKEAVQKKMR